MSGKDNSSASGSNDRKCEVAVIGSVFLLSAFVQQNGLGGWCLKTLPRATHTTCKLQTAKTNKRLTSVCNGAAL